MEKPISRKLDKQVARIVNLIFMEANCAGCGERKSIHDMDTDVETGKSYCAGCIPAHVAAHAA